MIDRISAPSTGDSPGLESDERTLIRGARADAGAFDALYRRYIQRVYRYIRARAVDEEAAADLTQQVFFQALAALPRYKERGLPFGAWLFRIAHNVAADAHRRRRDTVAWQRVPESLHPYSPQDMAGEAAARDNLRALLSGLDPERRELITLHFWADLPLREIALVVGKSQTTVQRQLATALQTLKERCNEQR